MVPGSMAEFQRSGGARWGVLLLVAIGAAGAACRGGGGAASAREVIVDIETAKVTRDAVTRQLRVSGTLMADEEAEVAAETAGRVIATPVERGTVVADRAPLIQVSTVETEAQVREAEANVEQIEVRLGISATQPFEVEKVPEVSNARASRDLAASEFDRIRKLYDDRVVSKSEFDQRRNQADATARMYETASNNAQQLARSLEASRARLTLARKALADTTVRSPFAGVVVERKVSIGDYVTKGMKVVTVVRIRPLRVELTIPEQSAGSVRAGSDMVLEVDAYPGRAFRGQVRYISPSVRTDQRALVVEAVLANDEGMLKPGMFATATIQSTDRQQALFVPATAVRDLAGSRRVYVLRAGYVEERVVTVGQVVGDRTEIATGVAEGEEVAQTSLERLSDGVKVRVAKAGSR